MAVIKNKDMNWKTCLRQLAEMGRISDFDRIELSGYLLRRDMESDERITIFNEIFALYDYDIMELMSLFLVAESPDTVKDLHMSIRNSVTDYYHKQIDELIREEIKIIREENLMDRQGDDHDCPHGAYFI